MLNPLMRIVLRAGLAVLMLSPLTTLHAQDVQTSLGHMPEDTLAVVTIWPSALAAKPSMEFAPLEMVSAVGLDEFGFDPLLLSRVDVMIGMPGMNAEFGALLQTSEPVDIAELNEELTDGNGIQREGEVAFMVIPGRPDMVVYQINDSTVVVGTPIFAKRMLDKHSGASDLARTLASIRTEQDALAVVSIAAIRPLLAGSLQNAPPQAMPPQLRDSLLGVIEGTDIVALRLEIADNEKLQLVLSSQDEATADSVAEHLGSLLQFARQTLAQQLKADAPQEGRTGAAMHQYVDRTSNKLAEMLAPRQVGSRLIIEVDELRSASLVGTMTGLLLPAIQSARQAARRMQSSNNLKQLGLAMHNFASAYRTLPATAGVDDDGEPMLSWRVAILPFIEQSALYERFNLDEPWDSEHNLALLEEMPDVFRNPKKKTQAGYTVYQAPVGDETLLRRTEPSRFAEITDGTSNTIMLVETSPEAAVPWTAPQDFDVDIAKIALEKLFFQGKTQVTMGDGSVRSLEDSIDREILKALFTRAGGEVVNW